MSERHPNLLIGYRDWLRIKQREDTYFFLVLGIERRGPGFLFSGIVVNEQHEPYRGEMPVNQLENFLGQVTRVTDVEHLGRLNSKVYEEPAA